MTPGAARSRRGFIAAAGWALLALALPVAAQQTLSVSAASSLGDAMRAVSARFEAAHPGVRVRLNLGASGLLVQQVVHGAPVDVFVSADPEALQRAVDAGVIAADSRRDIARNSLVLVVPATGGRADVRALVDLTGPTVRRVAIGKPASVPAGRYAMQVLDAAGLSAQVQPRLVFGDNVRQVLDYVARGEVDAGFVYRSDAAMMPERVRTVGVLGGHSPVVYPAAVVSASRQQPLAREFVAYLLSPEAQALLVRHGFSAP
jgi:molybdate transport system substrate-binding protein